MGRRVWLRIVLLVVVLLVVGPFIPLLVRALPPGELREWVFLAAGIAWFAAIAAMIGISLRALAFREGE